MWIDAVLGWLPRIALPRRRTTLVVLERGYADTTVDPRRYRLSTPAWVAHAFARLLPQPDLTLVLDAPADVIRARKPELSPAEVERQLAVWRTRGHRTIDASGGEQETLASVLAAIDDHLASRHSSLAVADTAMRALGTPSPRGTAYGLITRRGRPRFVAPAGSGPLRTRVYVPGRARDAVATRVLELQALMRLERRIRLDRTSGIATAVAEALGVGEVRLAAAAQRDDARGGRAVLAVHGKDGLLAYAKIAEQGGTSIAREHAVLRLLEEQTLRTFVAPRPLGTFDARGLSVLLLEPLVTRGNPLRRLGAVELETVAELAQLGPALAPALGSQTDLVPVHGDFAPWNCGVAPDGRLALWDWEDARLGLPLEDVFHWTMERMLLLGKGDAEDLVRTAISPDSPLAALALRLGVGMQGRLAALRAALETSSAGDEALRLLAEQA
jgi:hypothetical protein